MWNLWAQLCKQILLENSPLTQIANLYKLSSCWSHARCRNLSISIPEQTFFLQPSEHMCLREITHAFYIDEYAAFSVLLFIPRPSSEHMCFRETTHALNIDDLSAQTYKWVYSFLPQIITMGLLFCPNIFSFAQSLHYHMSQLRVHGFNFLSQIHLSLRQSSLHP